ncbi:hypothetical protein L798_03284 [Zootermopsis nevadensis]|uniref:Uncharacterized protein n=1 Tax=Zootermopsis nevadensis TaxID=136037 RepID=A0A067RQF5_ZOONE|nr:hypothetical protein L798_03284 [Zootermopsis nevadensis]
MLRTTMRKTIPLVCVPSSSVVPRHDGRADVETGALLLHFRQMWIAGNLASDVGHRCSRQALASEYQLCEHGRKASDQLLLFQYGGKASETLFRFQNGGKASK